MLTYKYKETYILNRIKTSKQELLRDMKYHVLSGGTPALLLGLTTEEFQKHKWLTLT